MLLPSRITELAAGAGLTIDEIRPGNAMLGWLGGRTLDPVAWRARGYFALKLPLAVAGLAVAAAARLGGAYQLTFPLTFPAWWSLGLHGGFGGFGIATLASSFALLPAGACSGRSHPPNGPALSAAGWQSLKIIDSLSDHF